MLSVKLDFDTIPRTVEPSAPTKEKLPSPLSSMVRFPKPVSSSVNNSSKASWTLSAVKSFAVLSKARALALVSMLVIVSPLPSVKVYTPSVKLTLVVLASISTTVPSTAV